MQTRLNKYLSEVGYCSRREADRLIEAGKVTVNDTIPVIGYKVSIGDIIKVNGSIVKKTSKYVFIAFNKPVGIVCTTDRSKKNNIVDFINHKERIFHIGRLDKDSEGLIFLTNDGDIVNKILRSGNLHEKEYIVTVNKKITDKFLYKMRHGVPILDTITKPCIIEQLDSKRFKIVLTQGLNRQIRRMCAHFDYEVTKLKRIRIMNVSLDLEIGKWRSLSKSEMSELNRLIKNSIKTEEASIL
ncbi:23S rRNA pseudouridine(2604) synthase RluF [Mycoplasmatota bacterium]|nr:23S rRNA pseudouridine(2604) synthase RluF [Mycoplasmatota bacterium]